MIEQLQKRLTLLLSAVSIFLLLFLLLFLFYFNRNSLYSGVKNALSSSVQGPMNHSVSENYPIYQIFISDNGEVLESFGEDYFLETDTEEKLVQDALSKIKGGKESFYSFMGGGELQYYCEKDNSPEGFHSPEDFKPENGENTKTERTKPSYRIAVTDFSKEIKSIKRLSIVLIALFFLLSTLIIILSRFFVRKSVRPVKEAMLSQRQFISDASHELKTPLTVIINNVGNLQKNMEKLFFQSGERLLASEELLRQNIENNIAGIEEMSTRMKHLTESLLDLSRLENLQDRKEQFEKLSLSHIAEQECMYFEPLFFDKGRSLEYTIEEELYVLGNEEKLKELLSILLENALKYSVPNTATELSLVKKKKLLVLGISNVIEKELSEEERKNLFKRFFRLDESHSGGKGYGLGLSIAKEIVTMHKGEIKVGSEKKYIHFIVFLPWIR